MVFCGNRHMRVMFEPPPPDAHGIGLGADARLQKRRGAKKRAKIGCSDREPGHRAKAGYQGMHR